MIQNRKLNEYEKNWLEKMLSMNFAKKNEIIAQINQSDVSREYTAYYLSIKFTGAYAVEPCPESIGVPLEMRVYLKNEAPIQFLLHMNKGVVTELEVFKADSSRISSNINLDNAQIEILIDFAWK